MAQTRRKRQTKHRGNAAGVVESRGRTGRKPTTAEKTGPAKPPAGAAKKAVDRRDQPPTWKAAFYKAMIAGAILLLFSVIVLKSSGALVVFPIVIAGYTVISYYTDKWVYDRRQRKKAREGKAQAR